MVADNATRIASAFDPLMRKLDDIDLRVCQLDQGNNNVRDADLHISWSEVLEYVAHLRAHWKLHGRKIDNLLACSTLNIDLELRQLLSVQDLARLHGESINSLNLESPSTSANLCQSKVARQKYLPDLSCKHDWKH